MLDERVVITGPVSTNRVTTISFPGPISAIDALGVTADGKTPENFQLAHTKGSSFVSVRALAREAATNLTSAGTKRTYVFELIESDSGLVSLPNDDCQHFVANIRPSRIANRNFITRVPLVPRSFLVRFDDLRDVNAA